MTAGSNARQTVEELIAQLDHADQLITEQAERIETLEAEAELLRAQLAEAKGVAA